MSGEDGGDGPYTEGQLAAIVTDLNGMLDRFTWIVRNRDHAGVPTCIVSAAPIGGWVCRVERVSGRYRCVAQHHEHGLVFVPKDEAERVWCIAQGHWPT